MLVDPDREITPIPELPIALDELRFLCDLVQDKLDVGPFGPGGKEFTERLEQGLTALWSYWSRRARDPSRFVLKIKK